MKKTVAMAAGAALVVGGLGACWYTGNAFDRILGEQIARAKQESGVEITWLPTSENLFTRDGVLKIVVPPQTQDNSIPLISCRPISSAVRWASGKPSIVS